MSDTTGRAGFHLEHAPNAGDRGAVLHEAMRSLDPEKSAYWAERNPSIVLGDERLNEEMVNDGAGGFVRCTDADQVIAYGDERLARVKGGVLPARPRVGKDGHPIIDKKTGEQAVTPGTNTTALLVSHLPKSMCVEIPNFYPVLHTKGKKKGQPMIDRTTGEPMMRSRYVARDRDEARRYFEHVIEYMSNNVLLGGQSSVLGYSIQHSETTPHVQIIADNFAPDAEDPDVLIASASKMWTKHRSFVDAKGRQVTGAEKLRGYHAGLKEFLIEKGYDISPDFDEEMHLVGMGKDEYAQAQNTLDLAEHISRRTARDRHELDRDRAIADSIREQNIAERGEIDDDLELVTRVKKSNAAKAAQNAADAAQIAADRADLTEARIDDAEALSWHRSDADADILAARVAAEEEIAEMHYVAGLRERVAKAHIQAAADFEQHVRDQGYPMLDKVEDEVKREQLGKEFEGALAKIDPLPVVEDRHAAAARRYRAHKDANRAALTAGGTQETGPSTEDDRKFGE